VRRLPLVTPNRAVEPSEVVENSACPSGAFGIVSSPSTSVPALRTCMTRRSMCFGASMASLPTPSMIESDFVRSSARSFFAIGIRRPNSRFETCHWTPLKPFEGIS
jgi:hypothetical protein